MTGAWSDPIYLPNSSIHLQRSIGSFPIHGLDFLLLKCLKSTSILRFNNIDLCFPCKNVRMFDNGRKFSKKFIQLIVDLLADGPGRYQEVKRRENVASFYHGNIIN